MIENEIIGEKAALQAGGRWFESNSSHAENEGVTKVTPFFV